MGYLTVYTVYTVHTEVSYAVYLPSNFQSQGSTQGQRHLYPLPSIAAYRLKDAGDGTSYPDTRYAHALLVMIQLLIHSICPSVFSSVALFLARSRLPQSSHADNPAGYLQLAQPSGVAEPPLEMTAWDEHYCTRCNHHLRHWNRPGPVERLSSHRTTIHPVRLLSIVDNLHRLSLVGTVTSLPSSWGDPLMVDWTMGESLTLARGWQSILSQRARAEVPSPSSIETLQSNFPSRCQPW